MFDLLFMHFLFVTRMTMDAFVRKYKLKLYENSNISTNGECRLWFNMSSKDYGQIEAKLPSGEWRNFSPAKLSLILKLRQIPPASLECSHLCHNVLCINPMHLSLEPHGVNMQRKNCLGEGSCRHHSNYPDCMINLHVHV